MVSYIRFQEAILLWEDVKEFQFWTGTASRIFQLLFDTFLTWVTGKLLLEKTYPGRFLRAVGENPETAEFIGINSRRIKIFAYMICSFMMTVTAAFMICYNHAATPFSGSEYMSDSLIACCAGGFSLREEMEGLKKHWQLHWHW